MAGVDWTLTSAIVTAGAAIYAAVVATIAFIYAKRNLRKVSEQTELVRQQVFKVSEQSELVRQQVFGEQYDTAQIEELVFFLPERWAHEVLGFVDKQKDKELSLETPLPIPVGSEVELHIRWRFAQAQTLRGFTVGFDGEVSMIPKITDRKRAFVKKEWGSFVREEFIDWHGVYHCEYAHARRLPRGETFVIALRVKAQHAGEFDLNVEIVVAEAPNPFKGVLKVKCEGPQA